MWWSIANSLNHWVFWAAKILRTSPTAPSVSVLFHLNSSDRWSDQKAWPQHCQVSEEKEKANCLKSRGCRVYSHVPAPQAWCLHDFLCVIWLFALSRTKLLTHLCSCQSRESAFIVVVLPLVPEGGLLQHEGSRPCCEWEGREQPDCSSCMCHCCSTFQETVTKLCLGFILKMVALVCWTGSSLWWTPMKCGLEDYSTQRMI